MGTLARNWWALLVRGIAAVIFGLLALFWPLASLRGLILLFGAYALVDGLFATVAAARAAAGHERWAALLLEGLTGIGAAVIAFVAPNAAALALLTLIAAWAVITGVLELLAAVKLRETIEGEWLLGLAGVLSIALGAAMLAWPRAAALAIVWALGAYAIAFGATLVVLGMRLRELRRVPT